MDAWYRKGLRFECARCGTCCRGEPGYVWVAAPDVIAIAGYLATPIDVFEVSYLRKVDQRVSLIEKPNGDCIFWDHSIGCGVYPVRPAQCRAFPFWKRNVDSPEAWSAAAKSCPGIGRGLLYRAHEIQKRAQRT